MSNLERLQLATTLSDLADILGYKPSALSYIVYKIPSTSKYTTFDIPKKSGGTRLINAPDERLKRLQKSLAKLLMKCEIEINDKLNHKNNISHGFKKKFSIITNAIPHKSKRHVFNVDLKDFFPSINFGRVRGFFIKNKHFQLCDKIATIIAQIACHDNSLPQGSPCSPVISNLVGHLLDIRMVNLAKRAKVTYTRYADDLTFSTNKKEFPCLIAYKKSGSDSEWLPSKKLTKEIDKVGFTLNSDKISMQYKTSRQIATGLVVNKKVNVKREYYKKTRAMCHSLFRNDEYYFETLDPATKTIVKSPGNFKQLEGYLSFTYQVRSSNKLRKDKQNQKKNFIGNIKKFNGTSNTAKIYRDFLFYKHCFALEKPLIICEGKTDRIYLQCALKKLASAYPTLIDTTPAVSYLITFLNKTKNFLNVCNLADGTSGLEGIMDRYEKQMGYYHGTGQKHPVIILVDDDKGAKEIKKKIIKKNGKVEPYQKYTDNLYVVFIPRVSSKNTAIEDLFDPSVLATVIDGKTFNKENDIDRDKEYSKQVFAHKVVKANQDSINFDNFRGVFDLFLDVISDYA